MKQHLESIKFSVSTIAWFLAGICVLLITTSIATQLYFGMHLAAVDHPVLKLVNVDAENNIPSFFTTFLQLGVSVLLLLISFLKWRRKEKFRFYWAFLTLCFFYISVDDAASLHDLYVNPMQTSLGPYATGLLYYAWTIPFVLASLLITMSYWKFYIHLHKRIRKLLLIGSVLLIGGGLGVEAISGYYDEQFGHYNFTYYMITTLEEGMEMAGVIFWLYGLMDYLATNKYQISFVFRSRNKTQPTEYGTKAVVNKKRDVA